jgi:hypothetical protein
MSMTLTTTNSPLIPTSMDQAIRLAEMMSRGKLVPQHLQGSPGDCLMIIEQSQRWGMSPFAVAQSTSLVKGRLNFEGKLIAAALHTSGILKSRLDYKFDGKGDDLTCTVSATLIGETEPRTLSVVYKNVRTENIWWTKQPEQQLSYSAARNWARRFAPEVMLGVTSPEEFEEVAQVSHADIGGQIIEGTAEPAVQQPAKRTVRQFLDDLKSELDEAQDRASVFAIVSREDVQKAFGGLKGSALSELEEMTDEADKRFPVGE